jgi:hypothetical protein
VLRALDILMSYDIFKDLKMAKKGAVKPRARKKKKKAGFNPKLQFMKIVAGLVLLVCLLVTAGLLANRFLMRPARTVAPMPQRHPHCPA